MVCKMLVILTAAIGDKILRPRGRLLSRAILSHHSYLVSPAWAQIRQIRPISTADIRAVLPLKIA